MGLITAPTSGSPSSEIWSLDSPSSTFGSDMQWLFLPWIQTSVIESPGIVFCTNFVSR